MGVRRMGGAVLTAALSLTLFGGAAAAQQTPELGLKVGDTAPEFEAIADNGEVWRSSEARDGKFLVVYFYPAAMTGGCTTQACLFRDNRSKLLDMGAEVVGVSGDRISNLRAFKGANRLNFPLLSDTAGSIAAAFGVPVGDGGTITRDVDGEEITLTRDVTTSRWTFIIGEDGKIVYKGVDVDPEGDTAAVIAAIERLTQG